MGPQRVQDVASVILRRFHSPSKFPSTLWVKLDQVVQDAQADLLQSSTLLTEYNVIDTPLHEVTPSSDRHSKRDLVKPVHWQFTPYQHILTL